MKELYRAVCPVVNVPFKENGEIDYIGLKNVVKFSLEQGCTSLCLFAFNSEPHKMSDTEKKGTIKKFLSFVKGKAQTLIGIIDNSVSGCIELAKHAEKCGADGIILYPPALQTPSGDALTDYFKTIASSVNIEVMIQDNPRSTGVNMSFDFLLDAYNKIENFNYIKVECPIPMRKLSSLVKLTDGKLNCYSGNGGIYAVEAFYSGAIGIMPGIATVKYFIKMYDLLKRGEDDKARTLFELVLPLVWYEDQSLEFYISCEKKLLKSFGVIESDFARAPKCVMTDEEETELFTLYNRMVEKTEYLFAEE